jgi:catechol 2,3-dioxygenase-like lactoylglutathione lyase family enzyme
MSTYPRSLNHIGVSVADIDAAIRWYQDVLGFRLFAGPTEVSIDSAAGEQAHDVLGTVFRKMRIAHLTTGSGVGVELFQSIDPRHERRETAVEFWKSGVFHFCVTDPDIEALAAKIVATGGRRLSKIWNDRPSSNEHRMVYCQDPFGTLIEIHTHSYEIVQSWR